MLSKIYGVYRGFMGQRFFIYFFIKVIYLNQLFFSSTILRNFIRQAEVLMVCKLFHLILKIINGLFQFLVNIHQDNKLLPVFSHILIPSSGSSQVGSKKHWGYTFYKLLTNLKKLVKNRKLFIIIIIIHFSQFLFFFKDNLCFSVLEYIHLEYGCTITWQIPFKNFLFTQKLMAIQLQIYYKVFIS